MRSKAIQTDLVLEGTADGDFVALKDTGGTPMATDYIFHFTIAP